MTLKVRIAPMETTYFNKVSCSAVVYRLGGVKIGLGLTGKLGPAWVGACVKIVALFTENYPSVVMMCGGGGQKNACVYYLDW